MIRWVWSRLLLRLASGVLGFYLVSDHCMADETDGYHFFTNASGQRIEAKVLAFDAEQGIVTLERRNGKSGTVPADALSPEDHLYLEQWLETQKFLNNEQLEIDVEFIEGKWKDAGDPDGVRKTRTDQFDISLINHGNTTLTNLSLEYCLYRDRKEYVSTSNIAIEIGELAPGKNFAITRKTVSYRKGSSFLNETVGARFRFMMPAVDGSVLMREICVPQPLPLDEYPWEENKEDRKKEMESMPGPATYPARDMTEEDIRTLAEQYTEVWKNEDFEAWVSLLSPMHPGDDKLTQSIFMSHQTKIKFLKITDIVDRDVKVKVYYKSGQTPEYWLQITPSGHIKYTPLAFRHPMTSIRMLYLLLNDDYSWRNTGYHYLTEAGIPTFGYNANDSSSARWKDCTLKILDWIREHGAGHDVDEPRMFLPKEEFTELLDATEKRVE